MGSSYSIQTEQDSPACPGEKVVLTSELPNVKHETLIEGILDAMRYPIGEEIAPTVKVVDVTDHSPDSFTVKVVMDGVKLDMFGFGDLKGTDRVLVWMRVAHTPAEGLIKTENYVPPEGAWIGKAKQEKVLATSCTRVLKDPVRVEFWREVDGERLAGDAQLANLKAYLDPVLELSKTRKVIFHPDSDSLHEPGQKSMLTDALDEFVSFEQLWAGLTDHKLVYPDADLVIEQISDTEVFVSGRGGMEPLNGAWRVAFDKDAGKIARTKQLHGKEAEVHTSIIHQNPLRIEVWGQKPDGSRDTSRRHAKFMAMLIDGMIEKVSSRSWW